MLSILVDENVERMVSTALRENGYDVTLARERYGPETVDSVLLDDALARGEVILTRDRDFAALATDREHGGSSSSLRPTRTREGSSGASPGSPRSTTTKTSRTGSSG